MILNTFGFGSGGGGGAAGDISGSGTAPKMPKFTAEKTIADSQVSDNGTTVFIGASATTASALFELNSTTQGMLFPRMTTTQRDAIPVGASEHGLFIYNITLGQFQYYDSNFGEWRNISPIVGALDSEPSHTGDTAETLVGSILIPANTLQQGDFIEINYALSKVGFAGTSILRARVDTSPAVGGDVIIYKETAGFVANPTNDMSMLKVIPGSDTLFYLGGIDWTVNQYINVTIQLNNAADLLTVESFYIKRYQA